MALTPEQRRLRARMGGLTAHSRHDSATLTAPALAAFLARFEKQVDPEGVLSMEERQRVGSPEGGSVMDQATHRWSSDTEVIEIRAAA